MPNGAHGHHLSTPRARNGEPQPAPPPTSEPASAKRDLTSWWKQFSKRGAVKKEEEKEPEVRGIFGVPLITSIPYANVAISLFNETGESYIYGYVPIVVAKCGVFLKEKATDVEGIFRLAGSEKRIKELKVSFDTPPRYGKGLDWTGFTVHDAANILRRYFNQLPEPIIPLQYYGPFRHPLENHQAEAVGHLEGQGPSIGGFDPDAAVRIYQQLIKDMPSLNRQLLLYILDLLAVFAAKADVNKMTTSNLAAIFQPGILSHPQHAMSPQDYRLSQDVLIFLIDNQDHFLIGMEGTAVDERTVKHIESGPSTPQTRTPTTPGRTKTALGRSASTSSSAGAESLRKFGIRRNVSTSSRQSRHSGAVPSPTTPSFGTPTGSGVHRSNTLPSKRSPALAAARFPKEKHSDPPTPATEEPKTQIPTTTPEDVVQDTNPLSPTTESNTLPTEKAPVQSIAPVAPAAAPAAAVAASVQAISQPASQHPNLPIEADESKVETLPEHIAPPNNINIGKRFAEERIELTRPTPTDVPGAYPLPSPEPLASEEIAPAAPATVAATHALSPPPPQRAGQRSPLLTPTREKSEFIEGPIDTGPTAELTPAVRTFTQILSKVSPSNDEKRDGRKPNKLQKKPRGAGGAHTSAHSSTHSLTGHTGFDGPPSPTPHPPLPENHHALINEGSQQYNNDTVSSRNSGATLKPTMSPSPSFRTHSTATEYSEADHKEEPPKEERKSFWKHKRGESKATPTASQTDLTGSVPGAGASASSFGSSSGWTGRRSLQFDSHQAGEPAGLYATDSREPEKKGPLNWFREKRQEIKEREAAKQRAKSPPPGGVSDSIARHQHLGAPQDNLPVRGRSMDIPRSVKDENSNEVTPTSTGSKAPVVPAPAQTNTDPAAQTQPQPQPQIPTQTQVQPQATQTQPPVQAQTQTQVQQPQAQRYSFTKPSTPPPTISNLDTVINPEQVPSSISNGKAPESAPVQAYPHP
ncbi:Rho-GTPase-activating protein 5 [Dendryphion nanum]|uniref:Rho-GTPase-activating protein 5 n=1 Tax=Dendryphion nanum TaxID=256645 RepID=A0A9P9IBN1_9PLEO|nr:Rho-GTPase-activating protein 5 [Dendryphion nanum]